MKAVKGCSNVDVNQQHEVHICSGIQEAYEKLLLQLQISSLRYDLIHEQVQVSSSSLTSSSRLSGLYCLYYSKL